MSNSEIPDVVFYTEDNVLKPGLRWPERLHGVIGGIGDEVQRAKLAGLEYGRMVMAHVADGGWRPSSDHDLNMSAFRNALDPISPNAEQVFNSEVGFMLVMSGVNDMLKGESES